MLGLPLGTVASLGLMIALPLLSFILHRVDRMRGGGHVTVLGRRFSSDA